MLLALSSCKNKPADGQQPTADSIQPAPTTEKPTNGQTSDDAFTCKQITREKTDKVYHVKLSIDFPVSGNDPLVNAVRNLICDHEINGFLQIMKVAFETLALAMGTVAALGLFGRWITW